MPSVAVVQEELQRRLRAQRDAAGPMLRPQLDELFRRRDLLSDDLSALFHPLAQPIAVFPLWVAAALRPSIDDAMALDAVEASVTGYLYVRVHDDRLDEDLGDPDVAPFLADHFLVRLQVLLAGMVGSSPRFWDAYASVARRYSDSMLFEREAMRADRACSREDFERILERSMPLVLPALALVDRAGRWDLAEPLRAFVWRVVRAGQLVDDLLDCEADLAAGRMTWLVRRFDGEAGRTAMLLRLAGEGIDELVAEIEGDLAGATASARDAGLDEAEPWLRSRQEAVVDLRDRFLRRVFSA